MNHNNAQTQTYKLKFVFAFDARNTRLKIKLMDYVEIWKHEDQVNKQAKSFINTFRTEYYANIIEEWNEIVSNLFITMRILQYYAFNIKRNDWTEI